MLGLVHHEKVLYSWHQISIHVHVLESQCRNFLLQYPEHGFYGMIADKILLFRHDSQTQNVLQIINNPADVKEGCLVEVVLSGMCTAKFLK